MGKLSLLDKSFECLCAIVQDLGEPKFRAKQLYDWILSGAEYSQMTNLPKAFKEKLAESFDAVSLKVEKILSAKDGSQKYLYKLNDGQLIEGVFLPNKYGNTLCVSTQVGCRMGCAFCASGEHGLERNLTASEIVGQFIAANRLQMQEQKVFESSDKVYSSSKNNAKSSDDATHNTNNATHNFKNDNIQARSRAISNIVFMGSGEPLDNFDNVVLAIKQFSDPKGLNISARNISLSTCGLVPQIIKLIDYNLPVTLSLSLHATNDQKRQKLMPIAKKYPILETIDAFKKYFVKTGRRVCIEYVLVAGQNDSDSDADRLAQLLSGFSCHINLINLNLGGSATKKSAGNSVLKASDAKKAQEFLTKLLDRGISASLRRSYGADVFGACGQLRGKEKAKNNQ